MGFPSGISAAVTSLFRTGVEESMDPRVAKRIVLSNQISMSMALISLPMVIIYMFSDAVVMALLEIPIILGYASVHRFNKAGFNWFSRFWLISLANLDILVYILTMGKTIGLHLFYLQAGVAPLVLFNWEERKSIVYGVAVSFLLFMGTEAFTPMIGMLYPVAEGDIYHMKLIEMFNLDLVQVVFIIYFFRGNRATEVALTQAGEEAKADDEAKSRFLAKMSGEIRVPLSEILSRAHVLMKSGLGAERRETLDDIQLSAQDLLAIVDELLDLSRLESGQMRLDPAPFSPLRLAHSVLRPFEFDAGRKRLELSLQTAPDLPGHLIGDSARIKQVLRNLIGNAFKFTDTGRIVLRIARGKIGEDPKMHTLVFEIEDSGIGIPDEARSRIFEPFAQADATTTRKYGGTGLGLFISKQIVEMMGGSIGLRSGERGGTIFHFSISLPLAAEPAGNPPIPAPALTPTPGFVNAPSLSFAHASTGIGALLHDGALPAIASKLKILVVDDHALNRKVLESFLLSYGLSADLVASAEKALEAYGSAAYHLVFMDCHMPGMDGYECARRLRLDGFPWPRPTIIGVTADAMGNTLRRCLDAGMDALLIKPIMEKQLRAVIADCASRIA